jgi:hypothetical protein
MLRRRIQLSLRTSMVLTFIAGVLVGGNVVPRQGDLLHLPGDGVEIPLDPLETHSSTPERRSKVVAMTARGWPLPFQQWYEDEHNTRRSFEWTALSLNIFLTLIILTISWVALEWLSGNLLKEAERKL